MPPLVSIVLNNFNYEPYLATAIDSALAQDHPDVEVVVVDDGSTDGSWDVISGYGDRIVAILQENAGQPRALNRGFEESRGEIVLFLDSDDFLYETAASSVVAAWADGCVKVQYRLSMVDRDGRRTGALPAVDVPLPSGDVRPLIARSGGYLWPVTSGNAYSRALLDELMPIPEQDFQGAADSYLNLLAPFYGSVISLQPELGAYRVHGANAWVGRGGAAQLRRFIEHDWRNQHYVLETARRHGYSLPEDLVMRDWWHVLHRLSYLRLDPEGHPAPGDTRLGLTRAGLRAIRHRPEFSGAEVLYYALLMVGIAVAPGPLARPLVTWANTGKPRPRWLRLARRAARAVKLPRLRRGAPSADDQGTPELNA